MNRCHLDMSEDEKAIRALIERWMSATETGDLNTVLDLMTDDVVFLVPERSLSGKQNLLRPQRE